MFIEEKIHNLNWKINLMPFEREDKGWMLKRTIDEIKKWPLDIAQNIHFLISSKYNKEFYEGKSKFTEEYRYFLAANKVNWKINDNIILPSGEEGCKFAQY